MSRERKQLGWIFAAIIVVGFVVYFGAKSAAQQGAESAATEQAQNTYITGLHNCHRGNTRQRVLHNIAVRAGESRAESAKADPPSLKAADERLAGEFAGEAKELTELPYAKPDGSTNCHAALAKEKP